MQPVIPLLIVTRSLDTGGTERHLLQVLPQLDPSRFAVEVLPLHPGGGLLEAYAKSGMLVHRVAPGVARLPRLAVSLVRRILARRPLVHTFLPEPYLVAAPIALSLSARGIVMSRRSLDVYQTRHPWMARMERALHPHMQALLGNSQAVAEQLLEEGAPPQRVHVIYNGLDIEPFPTGEDRKRLRKKVRETLGVDEGTCVLACVANLFAYKGHTDLLDALIRLPKPLADHIHLLCIGRDEGEQAKLEAQVRNLRLRVQFLGARTDIPGLLAAADIGVLASHQEGFSNAVLEGMASGLPMVVTDVGGNPEAVLHEECGLVVPAHNSAALAAALERLAADVSLRQAMGRTARARVEEKFSVTQCVAAYEELYQSVWRQYEKKY